jgi:hypothetical protein
VEPNQSVSRESIPRPGNSGSCKENTSSLSTTARHLMFIQEKILKLKKLLLIHNMLVSTRNGESSTSKTSRSKLRVSTRSSVFSLIDHSSSSTRCQWREYLQHMGKTLLSRATTEMIRPNNSSSTTGRRPLCHYTQVTKLCLSQSNQKEKPKI